MTAINGSRFALLTLICIAAWSLLSGGSVAAAPDTQEGAQSFARCAGCHSTRPGENRVGPSLSGVFGRTSASVSDFNYSTALKNAKIVWDEGSLDKFLQNPNGFVHGTKMFAAVPNAGDRQRIIAYLKTLSPAAPSAN